MTDKELKTRLDTAAESMNPLAISLISCKALCDIAKTANDQGATIHKTLMYVTAKLKERQKSEQEKS